MSQGLMPLIMCSEKTNQTKIANNPKVSILQGVTFKVTGCKVLETFHHVSGGLLYIVCVH